MTGNHGLKGNIMSVGKNTIDGGKMMTFVQRVEDRERAKKTISDEITLIYAEAKKENLAANGLRAVVKARKLKPSQFRELEDLRDVYFHAAGLAVEPPLFKSIEALAGDGLSKDALIESFKKLVPPNGSIVIEMEGPPLRLKRNKDGEVTTEEVKPPKQTRRRGAESELPDEPEVEIPDVDADGAEKLGVEAAKADKPIIENPFPFGDKRRARWDGGWRKETGSDGMGPDEE